MLGVLLGVQLISLCLAGQYDNYKLIRFEVNDKVAKWLEKVEAFAFDIDDEGNRQMLVDVFSEPSTFSPYAEVMVAPSFYDVFLSLLNAKGVHHVTVIKKNMQKDIDEEMRSLKRRSKRATTGNSLFDFDEHNYHSYDAMQKFMHNLAREMPHRVKVVNIGRSFEGRQIEGIKIWSSDRPKPAIVVDAGVHAREWVAPAVALYMIKKLVSSYGTNQRITTSLNAFDWYIIPQVNPDGYEYSRVTDRLWRKTRSRNATANRWCIGADANRNWGYRWGEAGANRFPCSNVYQGSHPFSEPEIVGLRDFLSNEIPHLMVYISLHAYGQVLLAPWGYTSERPANYDDQRKAAIAAVQAMRNTTGAHYKQGTISEVMYPASGTSIDYMQNKGVPYIYGVELRPTDTFDSFAFNIPPKYIAPTGDEMLAGILAIGEYATKHKKL